VLDIKLGVFFVLAISASSASTGPNFFLLEPHAAKTRQTSVCGAETAGFKTTGFEPQPRQKTAHWLKGGEGGKLTLL
jgi:hypothetical protein